MQKGFLLALFALTRRLESSDAHFLLEKFPDLVIIFELLLQLRKLIKTDTLAVSVKYRAYLADFSLVFLSIILAFAGKKIKKMKNNTFRRELDTEMDGEWLEII